ncbi:MAG: Crp/Fnr family transcriptional regulator [Bauldia sp.]|nr:Crp/Fnr family transcriptional regulator [Bauldia sp.]
MQLSAGNTTSVPATERASELARLLRGCALFGDLDEPDVRVLAERARRQRWDAGATIFRAGDPGESLMGVLSGAVRISRPTVDGGEIIMADFTNGDIFGEIALLDGNGRSADAMALTNCEVIVLERRDLMPFLLQRPAFCVNLLRLLCGKLRIADERSSDFLFLDLQSRLAKALLRLCQPERVAEGAGRTSLRQGELARIVGGTRPRINRLLKEWERGGILQLSKGWIVVRDRARLAGKVAEPAR